MMLWRVATVISLALIVAHSVLAANGGGTMDYRVVEWHYGPEMHFNDWQSSDAKLVSAGGTVQVLAAETATVTRNDHPLPGGGDVQLALKFNFERIGQDGGLTVQFNCPRKGTPGFQVMMDARHVTILHKDNEVYKGEAVATARETVHTLELVTLDEQYAVFLDGDCLKSGRMEPPFTENEGRLRCVVRDADIRLITCEENFIVRDMTFPEWQRAELLYEEPFGATSLADNWVCNGEKPQVAQDSCVFMPMSVNMLRHRFKGPLAVDCVATPMPTDAFSAGVTDAIFIWMMDKPDGNLPEYMEGLPDAGLGGYMPLPFYWVDFGGTNNKTTRMRKNPHRHMVRQFNDRARLLHRNKTYAVTMVQNGSFVEFWVDGECWIQRHEQHPLTEGHMGLRAYVAGLKLSSLKIWRIEP
jgi:hypothetical protein